MPETLLERIARLALEWRDAARESAARRSQINWRDPYAVNKLLDNAGRTHDALDALDKALDEYQKGAS
jgi:hypothetical protein